MVKEGGGFFGETSPNVAIQVQGPAGAGNGAAFVSQSLPINMLAGQSYVVSLNFQNTGTTIWTAAARYRLASLNPMDNVIWAGARQFLPGEVAPGATATFTFTVRAPATPGNYNFQWGMIQEVVGRFGPASSNAVISVFAP